MQGHFNTDLMRSYNELGTASKVLSRKMLNLVGKVLKIIMYSITKILQNL